jgi:polyketide cyclase/dehydrase/lipid transport protein
VTGQPAAPAPSAATGRRAFVVRSRSGAAPEAVWPLIAEATRWKEWSFLDRSELERTGSPAPDGVGAVRRFTRHGIGSREEVIAWEPPHHLAYTILSGMPVRNYRADVLLEPDGAGTAVSWSVRFDERIPGSGSLLTAVLRRIVTRFAEGVARYAERVTA